MLRPGRPLPRTRVVLLEAVLTGLATLLVVAFHFRLWAARWREPWQIEGDSAFYLMVIRSLGRHGSYLRNPNLGWPFGQSMYDLPQGVDNAHLLVLRVLAAITGSPGATINLFYVITFFTVALVAHIVLRHLGFGRIVSALGAFVYAIAPYHFIRNEGHLLLSGYQLVPLGVLLALTMFDEPLPLLGHAGDADGGRRLFDRHSARTWWVLAACVGLASTGAYYLGFTLLLVGVAAVAHAVGSGRWRPIGAAACIIVVCGLAFAVNVSPTLRYQRSHGANTEVAARSPAETQLYGLKISQLFIPRQGHRVDKLASLSERSQGKIEDLRSEPGQQLGVIGALGLGALLVVTVLQLAGGARVAGYFAGAEGALLRRVSLLTTVCLLTGSVGGLSYLLSTAGARDLRSWNRISIVIAFLAVIAAMAGVERLMTRVGGGSAAAGARGVVRRCAPGVLVTVVALVAFADQTGVDGPAYAAVHSRFTTDSTFFATVRSTLGDGGAVYQLPFVSFPEAPARLGVGAYDGALGFVYQPALNWSYGFVRGRRPAYPLVLEKQPASEWLPSVAVVGFTGVVLDRRGYTADEANALVASITSAIGAPPVAESGGDQRYAFFDLRAFAAGVKLTLGADGIAARAAATLALAPPPGSIIAPLVPSAGG